MIANGQTYRDIVIYLDGSTFTNCTFERCEFIYSGQMGAQLDSNVFLNCNWEFSGPAMATIAFMSVMNSSGAENVVDQIIAGIKEKKPSSGFRPGRH